jgi:hypothetical protein
MRNHEDTVPIFRMRAIIIVALLLSGLIHFALFPEHLREAPLLGLGFVVVATCQVALAIVFLRRPAPSLWPGAVILTVFSLTVYVISRSIGLAFAGDHRHESIAAIDLVCKGAELLAVVGLLLSIHTTTRDWPTGRSIRMAPYNRYAYLIALVLTGAVAALYLSHSGSHFSVSASE